MLDAGVQLYYYISGERVRLDDATAKFMVAAKTFAAELEREKISSRTHEHLLTKARRGLNVGGRVFGYDNVERHNGEYRTHVEYAINEAQADIVRSIFEQYGAGLGLRGIAKDLNQRGVLPPRAGRRGTGSWSTRRCTRCCVASGTAASSSGISAKRRTARARRFESSAMRTIGSGWTFPSCASWATTCGSAFSVASRPTSRRERPQVVVRLVTCSQASLAAPNAVGR